MESRELGDFATLGEEIIQSEVLQRVADTSVIAALALSLTSKAFNEISTDLLARQMSQLIADITYIRQGCTQKQLQTKMQQIIKLVTLRPELMFVKGKNDIAPLDILFTTTDFYFQALFFEKAFVSKQLKRFVSHLDDCQIKLKNEKLDSAFIKLIGKMGQGDREELAKIVCTSLGEAQLSVERSQLDIIFNTHREIPFVSYELYDGDETISLLDFSHGKQLGADFSLYLSDHDKSVHARREVYDIEALERQYELWRDVKKLAEDERKLILDAASWMASKVGDLDLGSMVEKLVEHNLMLAISLSSASSTFSSLLAQAMTNKLLQLLIAVTHIDQETTEKQLLENIYSIEEIICQKPEYMLNMTNSHQTPVQYLFTTLDVYFQQMFLNAAEESGNLPTFMEQVKGVTCQPINTDLSVMNQAPCVIERSLLDAAFNLPADHFQPPKDYRLFDKKTQQQKTVFADESGDKLGKDFALFYSRKSKGLKLKRKPLTPEKLVQQQQAWCQLFDLRVEQRAAICEAIEEYSASLQAGL